MTTSTATVHPTRVVRFNLLAVLIGVALPFALARLGPRVTVSEGLATVAFVLMALNFFHGKVVTLEDEDYNRALIDRPAVALLDYALNLTVALAFVLMAFALTNPGQLIVLNIAIRGVDVVLVTLIRHVTFDGALRRAQTSWLVFNGSAVVAWFIVQLVALEAADPTLLVPAAFLAITVLDLAMDYSVNRTFYFSTAVGWDHLAELWDRQQGMWGDEYRRTMIVPRLLEAAGAIKGQRVLDLGCGNGSIARHLAREGAIVTAVDRSRAMRDWAASYALGGITYLPYDINESAAMVDGCPFDAIIVCFTIHDALDLANVMKAVRLNLKPEGRAVFVYESLHELEQTSQHATTRRRWLDARVRGGCRRQLLFLSDSRDGGRDTIAGHSLAVSVRIWTEDALRAAVAAAGLKVLQNQLIEPTADLDESRVIRRYRMQPRFRLLQLRVQRETATC